MADSARVSPRLSIGLPVYNGENYNRAEANDQKALQVRATVRAGRR